METMRTNKWLLVGCVLAMVVVSAVLYPSLPDQMPMQWGLNGEVNRYAPKWQAVLFLPVITVLLWGSLVLAPKVDPRRDQYEKFGKSYVRIREATIVFMAGLHIIILTQYDNPQVLIRVLLFAVALLIAIIGNEMTRFRQTWFVGIRTPWTLSDERVWNRTHRDGARYFFLAGAINMVLVLLLPIPVAGPILVISVIGVSIGIMIYSYRVYRQLNG